MRQKYITRPFLVRNEQVRETLLNAVRNLPLDSIEPLEVVIREQIKGRRPDANALYWIRVGEIASQAWLDGRQFDADTWHIFFRRELLPEEFDAEKCREGYAKWRIDPGGERALVGSTTQLTVKGFSEYLESVTAFGASLGVQFSASPNER